MQNKLQQWVKQHKDELGIEGDFSLVDVSKGESNHVYEILIDDQPQFIVRTSKEISEDRINRESKILELLNSEKIFYAPKKICKKHSDDLDQEVLVETHIGNIDVDFSSLSNAQLSNLAERLAEIHSLNVEPYSRYFSDNRSDKVKFGEYFEEDFQKYSKEPYQFYVENTDSVNSRIESAFEKHKKLYSELESIEKQVEQGLIHGDPSDNLRVNGGEVCIIDWELSRPGIPRFELIYMFRHNRVGKEKREFFLKKYRKHRETSDLADQYSEHYECFLAFNDMIWAAKRNEKLKIKNKDYSRYEKMLEERLDCLEKLYKSKNFFRF